MKRALLFVLAASVCVFGYVFLISLIVMIFLHELGHFVMARRADMKVTEFFIGFGPRIWSFRRDKR